MKDNFYQIKPLEEWLTSESGLIVQNDSAFVSLAVNPSAFGHSLVIPKKIVYKATELSPQELMDLHRAKEVGLVQLHYLVAQNLDHIVGLYKKWAGDDDLNEKLSCRERIEIVMKDFEQGKFNGAGNVFENVGQQAGQMVKHYHLQIVPRFREDLKGNGDALYRYLHS
jgi:diadenosine tetraphosphate (Ap4A) HIT family hydrolase